MFRGIIDLFNLLLWWSFMYVGSFMIMIVAIFYVMQTNPTPPTPIIKQYNSTVQVIQPPKRVLVEREVCTRIDGCRIIDNVCVDYMTTRIKVVTARVLLAFPAASLTIIVQSE